MSIKEELENYMKEHPFCTYYYNKMQVNDKELVKKILEYPILANDEVSFAERIYCILNGMKERQKCKTCNRNEVTFDSKNFSYRRFCSASCGQLDPDVQKKLESTMIERHGVRRACQSKEILAKSEQTCIKKYGRWYLGSKDCMEKSKQTFLERYGDECYANTEDFKEKSKRTCLEKYGVEYSFQSENNKNKTKETLLKEYGVEHIGSSKEIQERIHNTNMKRLGVSMPLLSKEIHNKTYISNREHRYEEFLKESEVEPLFSKEEFVEACITGDMLLEWRCKKCGNKFYSFMDGNAKKRLGNLVRCTKCYPKMNSISNEEKEVLAFVRKYEPKAISGCKTVLPKQLQLDIFCKDRNLAIEFDGLFWHSDYDGNCNKYYHLYKTEECEKQGIQLIHIFEDEWLYKKNIVKSYIKGLLGIYERTYKISDYTIKEVPSNIAYSFLNENHIDGAIKSKINIGALVSDELIAVMTVKNLKNGEYLITRFSKKIGVDIEDCFERMLKFFEETYSPKTVKCSLDRRWHIEKELDGNGFQLAEKTPPKFDWTDKKKRIMWYQIADKRHISKLLPDYDLSKTVAENMFAAGYSRIWDCGKLVFVKHYA